MNDDLAYHISSFYELEPTSVGQSDAERIQAGVANPRQLSQKGVLLVKKSLKSGNLNVGKHALEKYGKQEGN
jgi:hypothetical protein